MARRRARSRRPIRCPRMGVGRAGWSGSCRRTRRLGNGGPSRVESCRGETGRGAMWNSEGLLGYVELEMTIHPLTCYKGKINLSILSFRLYKRGYGMAVSALGQWPRWPRLDPACQQHSLALDANVYHSRGELNCMGETRSCAVATSCGRLRYAPCFCRRAPSCR